jgi:hypothetical protein
VDISARRFMRTELPSRQGKVWTLR